MSPKRQKRKRATRRVPEIFVDTGGWYALADESDPDHLRARDWFKQNRLPSLPPIIILDETLTLIRTSLGYEVSFQQSAKEGIGIRFHPPG
ncbi:TPA: hypothetical protein DD712_04460, partial [Candidatus Acetothermia bacterium]|nr:hypothetical protein [Candidatus Acetothermia bacterium]